MLCKNVFCGLAGVDALLQFINDYSTPAGSAFHNSHPPAAVFKDRCRQMAEVLPAHGEAFDRGLFSSARLVEVLVPPFLKLARKTSRAHPTGDPSPPVDAFFHGWTITLTDFLQGKIWVGNSQTSYRRRAMRPKKRQELVKALEAARLPEVYHYQPFPVLGALLRGQDISTPTIQFDYN